jgi:Periplasmic copper-binding protein (NosD)
MKRIMTALAVAAMLASVPMFAVSGGVAHATVGGPTCYVPTDYPTIQDAVNDSGCTTISVANGTYVENVTINRSLTLTGDKNGKAIIEPEVSDPDCGDPTISSSLCGSNIILVQADNVTIQNLTLNGDNPALNGVNVGGANVDARNGIITDHVGNNLDVHAVTVENVYLRGIYARGGGTFNFHNDTVDNVQGGPFSVAMFNYGGAGTFADNTVSEANDAISSNHSSGVNFLNNTVTNSASGIHTDNAGDGGGTADVIQGNTITNCASDGYGIFVFVPYIAPTVRDNKIRKCDVGLAAFGGGVGTPTTSFVDNDVNGAGALHTQDSPVIGALVTTDQIGFDCHDVSASFSGNTVKNNATGFELQLGPIFPTITTCAPTALGVITVTLHTNNIFSNGTGVDNKTNNTVDATNNWWGCSKGPNTPGCDTIVNSVGSATNYIPFLTKPA